MPKKKGKLKGVTFQLVHRSQQDPLAADDAAPQRVLVPKETKSNKEKRMEEQHKYGIYFDDDSNYLQHLKDRHDNHMEWPENVDEQLKQRQEANKSKINLPSSVFASEVEEDVGLLNRAMPISGPQLHLDPDLVAAMDDDFDYDNPDNELEDNFIELAEGVASDEDDYDANDRISDAEQFSGSEDAYSLEETKSRFTEYSMTSSVIRRNEQLTLLDERFEKMYAQYDENEIGSLEDEEIEGYMRDPSDLLKQCVDEFEKQQKSHALDKENIKKRVTFESDDSEAMEYVDVDNEQKWDCESILSTYSNLYNHPKLIEEPSSSNKIRINKQTGIPQNVLGSNLNKKALRQLDELNGTSNVNGPTSCQSVISQLSTLSIRSKNETPEERKQRKKAFREYRRERRKEKKLNTLAFKEESSKQAKLLIHNKNNLHVKVM